MPIDYGTNDVKTSGNFVASSGNFTTALTVNNVNVSVSGHSHTTSDIIDFSSTVSGLLLVKDIIPGNNVIISNNSGIYNIDSITSITAGNFISISDTKQWVQRGSDIDGEAVNDLSGHSVSLSKDGNIVAIGARLNDGNGSNSGHVRVYAWNGSNWIQIGSDINGEAAEDQSGYNVSLNSDGSVLAIGAIYNDGNGADSGHVRVYAWSGSAWIQRGNDIDGEAASNLSGYSVSLSSDGNILAIGAINNRGNGLLSGHVRVYSWNGSSWTQMGSDIDSEAMFDLNGHSVSLNSAGNILAIGAPNNDGNGSNSGHVRVYSWNGSAWIQQGNDIDGEAAVDASGYSVSLNSDGSVLAIGAIYNDGNGSNSGHVRIYTWNGSGWTQRGNDIDGEATNDNSGYSVSLSNDGNVLAIGAIYNDDNGSNSGHVRIYTWNGSSWIQRGNDIDGEAASNLSGFSVSLSSDGNIVAIGATHNDGGGSDAGHVRVYYWDSKTINVTDLINNPASNRILTSRDNTTTNIDAENNLTFDGNLLSVSGNLVANTGTFSILQLDTDNGPGGLVVTSPSGFISADFNSLSEPGPATTVRIIQENPASGPWLQLGYFGDTGTQGETAQNQSTPRISLRKTQGSYNNQLSLQGWELISSIITEAPSDPSQTSSITSRISTFAMAPVDETNVFQCSNILLQSSSGPQQIDKFLSINGQNGFVNTNCYIQTTKGLSAPTPIFDPGIISGNFSINYSVDRQIQKLTLNGTTTNFIKGTGWPTIDSIDILLDITVTNTTTVSFALVDDWYNPIPAFTPGKYLVLLRSMGSIIQGHYIGNKTN